MRTVFVIVLVCFTSLATAQDKTEREQRIRSGEVPTAAVEWMNDAYESLRRVKWYYEETSGVNSYEAKIKRKGYFHSIEFDTSGLIQDIEVRIEWNELPLNVQENITLYLDSAYTKHKVQKIQKQWTGDPDDLEDLIDEDEDENLTIHYELEFYGKNDALDELWEGLFDEEGSMLEKRVIRLRPTDNLDF